ncbi:MAG: S9 family peptidase [Bryobacterales bacterium]|nr:S9 family peptidase [Bryobacterales bacterium]
MREVVVFLFAALLAIAADPKPVTPAAAAEYRRPSGVDPVWSPDSKSFVFRDGQAIRLYDIASRQTRELVALKALTERAAEPAKPSRFHWENRGIREREMQWLPSAKAIVALAKGDLFLVYVADGKVEQLTRTAEIEHDPKVSPDGTRVAYQLNHDLWVLDIAPRKIHRLTFGGAELVRNAELDWVYPEELALSTAYWWSPDSKRIAYLQFDLTAVMSYPHADLTGLRPVAEAERFPQAGTPNPRVRLGVVGAAGGKTRWLTEVGSDQLLARVDWIPESQLVSVIRLNRIQNRMEVFSINATSGKMQPVLKESDKTWVNLDDDYRYLSPTELIWSSERTGGFSHLYLVKAGTAEAKPITSGNWVVTGLACVDEGERRLYYLSTEPSPLERQLWTVKFDGTDKRRLSTEPGTHSASFSPDCKYYVSTHSSISEPPRAAVFTSAGTHEKTLKERDEKIREEYTILDSKFVQAPAKDGDHFWARLIKPANFDASRKYPAVVMVYGGPHAQMVVNAWKGLEWEQALAHKGFVVWALDNRGSNYRGHVWESRVYRRFGKQELADQLEGIEFLNAQGFVDPKRIGIYGWSFGGFMTLYSLLNAPETFKAGIAGAPVTDWRNYDSIYTERYLGLPSENDEGYRLSSPVHQAANLRSALMLVHNFEDDNVLFQHTLKMMDALQRAGKQFDLLLYPQKTHHVSGTVRKQMLESMTSFFLRHLGADK